MNLGTSNCPDCGGEPQAERTKAGQPILICGNGHSWPAKPEAVPGTGVKESLPPFPPMTLTRRRYTRPTGMLYPSITEVPEEPVQQTTNRTNPVEVAWSLMKPETRDDEYLAELQRYSEEPVPLPVPEWGITVQGPRDLHGLSRLHHQSGP